MYVPNQLILYVVKVVYYIMRIIRAKRTLVLLFRLKTRIEYSVPYAYATIEFEGYEIYYTSKKQYLF